MSYELPDRMNLENNKALRLDRYSIEIVDLESQQVLHQRKDHGGYHTCGTFTEDENIVIYLTFDKHWYVPPRIMKWDLKNDTVEEVFTSHDTQTEYLELAYHNATQCLVLGNYDGSMSAFNTQTLQELWYRGTGKTKGFLSLAFSTCGEKVAALQKDNLTIYDFTTGEKLLSTPLIDEYSTCQFEENSLVIQICHPEKATIKINCKTIYR